MEIKVQKQDIKDYEDLLGGAYALTAVSIGVNKDLDPRVQRNLVIHEIIEVYCRNWHHDNIEELTDLLSDGLDQLDMEDGK